MTQKLHNDPMIFDLPEGLPGFPDLRRFKLTKLDEQDPFMILESEEMKETGFVLADPLAFFPDYRIKVKPGDVESIGLTNEADSFVCVIVTLSSKPEEVTANLMAPLVFNMANGKAKQVILEESSYTTKHSLYQAIRSLSV